MIYTLAELNAMPTLLAGHTDDLKVDTATRRVWLSRMTVADGAPYDNQVTIERRIVNPPSKRSDGWLTSGQYKAV